MIVFFLSNGTDKLKDGKAWIWVPFEETEEKKLQLECEKGFPSDHRKPKDWSIRDKTERVMPKMRSLFDFLTYKYV